MTSLFRLRSWIASTSLIFVLIVSAVALAQDTVGPEQATSWRAGFAKVDITPQAPIRLSGYAARKAVSQGIADPLQIRTAVLYPTDQPEPLILVSIDAIAVPGSLTNRVAKQAFERWRISRSRLVLAATHTHTAPHLDDAAVNLFEEPLDGDELQTTREYTATLEAKILASIDQAMKAVGPVKLELGEATAAISANRRVLKDGIWKGFGVQEDGVVDHRVRLCSIRDKAGTLRSVIFHFPCHATTIPSTDNRVSADWPGLSASMLEKELDVIALPMIGCGADITPNPSGSYDLAVQNSKSIAQAVRSSLEKSSWTPLRHSPQVEFGYAGLPSEHPTREKLNEMLQSRSPQERNYADLQIKLWDRRGVLPETYPAPIHVWTFGDQWTWVFLGGEVVLDYQIRMERELQSDKVWVSSYCDDVFGYLASERMRAEGGYEVDDSMIYYNLPGRWQTGTEDLVIRRTREIQRGSDRERLPLSPSDAIQQFDLPQEFEIDLVASEPLVQDPVNFAFDGQGRLWVVEMRDYPLGSDSGGCVKILTDDDQDGTMDRATLFLDHLSYPNSVFPFRDGAIVACVPDIFFAADRDGDGYAEHRETWITGFPAANPQHRMNGFTYGLDGRLYMSSGEDASHIQLPGRPEQLRASGRDIAIDLESKQIEFVAGPTQYIRGRDDWNRWFGNANNEPMYQFVIEDRYLRNGRSIDTNRQFLTTPAVGPQVFPLSSSDSRFNDVFSANRFTSACSSIVCRTSESGQDMLDAALICEPVHNLVYRMKLEPSGAALKGQRFHGEESSEWLRSSDPWFRPVRIDTGTDGNIWIADMYRLVIEHPKWIPEAWQARVDLRAGEDRGRIYRVRLKDKPRKPLPRLAQDDETILRCLEADSGPLRDLAQQWIIEHRPAGLRPELTKRMMHHRNPRVRLQILATLDACHWFTEESFRQVLLAESNPRILQYLVGLLEKYPNATNEAISRFSAMDAMQVDHELAMHVILAMRDKAELNTSQLIVKMAQGRIEDPWIQRSLMLVQTEHQRAIIQDLIDNPAQGTLAQSGSEQTKNADASAVIRFVSRLLANSPEALVDAETAAKWLNSTASNQPPRNLPIVAAWLESTRDLSRQQLPAIIQASIVDAPKWLHDDSVPLDIRLATVSMLRWGEPTSNRFEAWAECLSPNLPSAIQEVAFDKILSQADDASLSQVLAKWPSLGPNMRLRITTSMLRQPRWILLLLQAIDGGTIRATDIDASSVQSMLNTWNRDVQTRAVRIFGKSQVRDRAALVERYLQDVSALKLANDPSTVELGKKIYQQHCAVCHDGKENQPALGPNLSSLTDLSDRNLLTAILDPNRAVDGKFKQYAMLIDDSTTLAGVIISESATSLIVGTADGKRHEISRSSVTELKDQGISLMPEGLERQLSNETMGQLLRYLQKK